MCSFLHFQQVFESFVCILLISYFIKCPLDIIVGTTRFCTGLFNILRRYKGTRKVCDICLSTVILYWFLIMKPWNGVSEPNIPSLMIKEDSEAFTVEIWSTSFIKLPFPFFCEMLLFSTFYCSMNESSISFRNVSS